MRMGEDHDVRLLIGSIQQVDGRTDAGLVAHPFARVDDTPCVGWRSEHDAFSGTGSEEKQLKGVVVEAIDEGADHLTGMT
jgi:hypothetical protein